MSGIDPVDELAEELGLEAVQDIKLRDARKKLALERAGRRQIEKELERATKIAEVLSDIDGLNSDPPSWTYEPPKRKHSATPLLLITDTHFGEVVEPEEIMGVNAYNAEIADQRLERLFQNAVNVAKTYFGGNLNYPGIQVAFGGDIFTGEIHDELKETNDLTPPEAFERYVDPMIAGLRMLREEFGRVNVVGVDGNHDRRYKQKKAKKSAKDSWSWLYYRTLARDFRKFSTVTFQIPDSRDALFSIYNTRFLLHHGDQFRGGSGISGALSPLMIGDARKRKKHDSAVRHTGNQDMRFDIQIMGHFHHRVSYPGIIVGGCMKGYDEYSNVSNFPYEPPSQEMIIVTPKHGITFQAPVWVQDPVEEGWGEDLTT